MAEAGASFEALTRSDEFRKWFWEGKNGNKVIDGLNEYHFNQHGKKGDQLRRESDSPTIYGLVINNSMDLGDPDWKLCKVGFTHVSTKPGSAKNRMEQVQDKIRKKLSQVGVSVLFTLPISPTDTTPVLEVESNVRKAIGFPIDKDLADKMGLPVKTEWVLTTQTYIDILKKHIGEMKDNSKVLSTRAITGGGGVKFDKRKESKLSENFHLSDKGQVCLKSASSEDLEQSFERMNIDSPPRSLSKSTPRKKASSGSPAGVSGTSKTPNKSSPKDKGAAPKRRTIEKQADQ